MLTSASPILGAGSDEAHPSPFEVGAGEVEGGLDAFVNVERLGEMRIGVIVAIEAAV